MLGSITIFKNKYKEISKSELNGKEWIGNGGISHRHEPAHKGGIITFTSWWYVVQLYEGMLFGTWTP